MNKMAISGTEEEYVLNQMKIESPKVPNKKMS